MNTHRNYLDALMAIGFLTYMLGGKQLHGLDLSNLLGKSESQRYYDREFDEMVANYK
jgi:hypothetical protein